MAEASAGGSQSSRGQEEHATMNYMSVEEQEPAVDLMETRTASTTTLHRLDMSPAPSSAPTARRSEASSRSEEVRFRVLCPISSVGAVIGRNGENIRRLRRETHAEVVLEEFVAGSAERVITVGVHRDSIYHSSTSGGDALVAVFDSLCECGRDGMATTTSSEDHYHEQSAAADSEPVNSEGQEEEYEIRLLVDSTQIGFLVGKSGAAIKATMEASGALVRVASKAELPTCAYVNEEVLLVSGSHRAVAAALRIICQQLEQHPPRLQACQRRGPIMLAHAASGEYLYMPAPSQGVYASVAAPTVLVPPGCVETVFRLLAPSARAGNIIGRGGDHIRRIRAETGVWLRMYGADSDGEERLVVICSADEPQSLYCAAQDALVRCAICLTGDEAAAAQGQHRVRLLAPQTSIGAVLGKKGSTIMQLRQETGAQIRVHPVEAPLAEAAATVPGGGEPGGDEIVQIDGTVQQCVAALRGVATLLRMWQARRAAGLGGAWQQLTAVALQPAMLAQPVTLMPMANGMLTLGAVGGSLPALPMVQAFASPGGGSSALVAPGGDALLGPSPGHSSVLWRYRLTNPQAGAVIGKGGNHVTQIRHCTGARVHLPTDQGPEGQRTLEISGAVPACQAAHTMVNQFLSLGQCQAAVPEHLSGAVYTPHHSLSPPPSQPPSPHPFKSPQQQQQQQEMTFI